MYINFSLVPCQSDVSSLHMS